jgi:hypothetical protein
MTAVLDDLEESDLGKGTNHGAPRNDGEARAHAGMSTGCDDRSVDMIGKRLILE